MSYCPGVDNQECRRAGRQAEGPTWQAGQLGWWATRQKGNKEKAKQVDRRSRWLNGARQHYRWAGRQRPRRLERWEGKHMVPQDMRAARQESSKVSGQQVRWVARQADSKSGGQTVSVIG